MWDLYYKHAEDVGFELGPREELARDPRIQDLFSVHEQNYSANFASGDHSILKDKEDKFLLETGLRVAVIVSSGLKVRDRKPGYNYAQGTSRRSMLASARTRRGDLPNGTAEFL